MAALTADIEMAHAGGFEIGKFALNGGVASDIWYKGAILYYLAAGRLTPVNTTAGLQPAGICLEQKTTTAVDEDIMTATKGCWRIVPASAALTDEGALLSCDASAVSDNPADLDTGLSSTGDTAFAFVVKFDDAGTDGLWCDTGRKAIAVVS